MDKENIKVTGVMINYYFICKRKLWYFSHGIQMEQEHDNVTIGKLIDENSYGIEKKHILIDGIINIDFIDGMKVIHEVKKSKSIEEATEWQLKYYLYYLKSKGVEGLRGMIDYPLLKQRLKIELREKDEEKIEELLMKIKNIVAEKKTPEVANNKICKSCAYYEMCYV